MITNIDTPVRLTQYSHGAGCGCKISPKVLDCILSGKNGLPQFDQLLVGNDKRDDAAVMELGDGTAIISTTDFFMPIVDDPADFGKIASVNAISDVYAMGGSPILAIAILGWPIDKLPAEVANEVIGGARLVCQEAGIPLAGGHSIDSPEPIFGLAVTGRVQISHLKTNNGAQVGDFLFLTKPIGVGILSTAQKKGELRAEDSEMALKNMLKLNSIGAQFGQLSEVHAMTDVTGFGLFGHLVEMCEASGTSAEIKFDLIPLLDQEAIDFYLDKNCIPGGTARNFDSYGNKLPSMSDRQIHLGCDPQTSGGLLVAVGENGVKDFLEVCGREGLDLKPIGRIMKRDQNIVKLI